MRVVELFSCAGGMAEGLRRAGLPVTVAFDFNQDACASYAANHDHAPVRVDARELVRMVELGASLGAIDFLVADPPCTPWSHAGKRRGLDDPHDMLRETCRLIELARPRAWLIANVPGLDDTPNWPIVQRLIGGIRGYDVDFRRLDAADYGVPQHRVRPFWFGRTHGTEPLTWPQRTHGPPDRNMSLDALASWITCRQALGHLPADELGAPVRLRWRGCNGAQVASVPDEPARVVGTSNLSDGFVLAHPEVAVRKKSRVGKTGKGARASAWDKPAGVVTSRANQGDGCTLFEGPNHRPSRFDAPARALTRNGNGDGSLLASPKHPAVALDEPATTVRGGGSGHSAPAVIVAVPHHPPSELDEPSRTVRATTAGTPDKLLLANDRHPINEPDAPSGTVTCGDRGAQGANVMTWPWDRPATVVHSGNRLAPPGHHEKSSLSDNRGHGPNAIKLSWRARALLQGFPPEWRFVSGTDKPLTARSRDAMIGMAMPPPLAEAVGRSIRRWLDRHERCAFVNHDRRQCERSGPHEAHYEPGCNFGWHPT